MSRSRHLALLAVLLAAAAVSVAACTGDGGDDGGSASPTPTEPFPATRCQIVWATENGALEDVFQLDAPFASWTTSSSHQFSVGTGGFRAFVRLGLDLDTNTAQAEAVVTSGAFALLSASAESGSLVIFTNDVPRPLFHVDSAGLPAAFAGTGATGSFEGFWSDPWSQNVVPGSGEITVVVDGTARTLGADLSYAVCYQ